MSGEVKNLKSIERDFELNDGEVIKLVVNFSLLYQLRAKKKEIYETYSKTVLLGTKDVFEMIQVLYVAYLCANINNVDSCMDFNTFIERMPPDVSEIAKVTTELIQPKKK